MGKTLSQKILEIQKECEFLKKDKTSYNYKYVTGVSIYGTIRKRMDELGVILETHLIDEPTVEINSFKVQVNKKISEYDPEQKRKIDRFIPEEKIVCERVFRQSCHMVWVDTESESERKIPWTIVGEQDEISKAFGSSLTYCKRYFILNYFNIPTDENDPDNEKNARNEKVYAPSSSASAGEKIRWGNNKGKLISDLGDLQDIRKHLNWSEGKPDLFEYHKALQDRMNILAKGVS